MSAIQIERVPDKLVDRLRKLAESAGTNLEAEALRCLEKGLTERELAEAELNEIRELRGQSPKAWLTDESLRATRNEGRM